MDPLRIEGKEKDYFLELLMGGSAPTEGAVEEPAAVGSKTGQSAKKGTTRGSNEASSGSKRKGSEKTPKGGSAVSARRKRRRPVHRMRGGPQRASQATKDGWCHLTSLVTRGPGMGDRKLVPSRGRGRERK